MLRRQMLLGGLGGLVATVGTTTGAQAKGVALTEPAGWPQRGGPMSVREFGARGTGLVDDSPAFDAALAFMARSGGSLYIPAGQYRIDRPLQSINLLNQAAGVRFFGDGPASEIRPNRLRDRLFRFDNVHERVSFEDVAFVGNGVGAEADCAAIAYAAYCSAGIEFTRCAFAGLRSDSTDYRGLIDTYAADIEVHKCYFGGSAHSSGAMIHASEFGAIAVTHSTFIDYMTTGSVAHTKTSACASASWIWISTPNAGASQTAAEQSSIVVRQCLFDEGALRGIDLDPEGGARIERALVEDCNFNVNGVTWAAGLRARNVDRLAVRRARFSGLGSRQRDAVQLEAVDVADLEHVVAVAGAPRLRADAATQYWSLRDCAIPVIASQAARARIEDKGVVTTFPVPV